MPADKLSSQVELCTRVEKTETSNVAHGLRMWQSGSGLLTYCTDDRKLVAVCYLVFSKIQTLMADRVNRAILCHCDFVTIGPVVAKIAIYRFLATVCKTVRPMLSDRCLSCLSVSLSVCLSVTLVYCGQTVGWIKMKLDTEVGLGLGHIVLDGAPAFPLQKGA